MRWYVGLPGGHLESKRDVISAGPELVAREQRNRGEPHAPAPARSSSPHTMNKIHNLKKSLLSFPSRRDSGEGKQFRLTTGNFRSTV